MDIGYRPAGVVTSANGDAEPLEDDGNAWDELVVAKDDSAPRIEPGEYVARVVRGDVVPKLFKRRTLVLTFEVVQSKAAGTRLKFLCAMPLRPGRHSKYMRAWEVANGGPAKRHDRTSPIIFRHRLFLVAVIDVTHDRNQHRLARPYSIISTILDRQA